LAAVAIAALIVGIAGRPAVSAAATRNHGYWIAGADAQVFAFGDAQSWTSRDGRLIRGLIEDIAAHPSGKGFWLLGRDGGVYPYGDARDLGQGAFQEQNAVAIASTPSGNGYWIASAFGEVRNFGDAAPLGSLERKAQRRIVDMATTPSGGGSWLVDASGEVFAFGDAPSLGFTPRTGSDVVAIAATPHGDGYWVATSGGETFAFGAAPAIAALSDPAKKIVDMTATTTGHGYWLVDRNGLVFPFGDAVLYGQLSSGDLRSGQIVAIVSTPFVNRDPVAVADTASLDEDTFVDVNVLANDTDEDGDPLTAEVNTQPAHGTATLNADGTIRYTPTHDYNGTDTFTYRVRDGLGGSAIGQVTLTIRPVNDAPVAANDAYTTNEDTPLTAAAPGLLANDTDVDGDALSASVTSAPAHGTLTIAPNGSFTYTPAANYNGSDAFSYQAADGAGASAIANVTLTIVPVPDPPIGTPDAYATDEDTTLTVPLPGVLGNDTDADGDALTAILVAGPAHGTLTLQPSGALQYAPAHDYNGADGFTYRASDGTLRSDVTAVAITVNPVNDPPVATADRYDATEDTALVVAGPGVLANDTDVDGDALTAELAQTTTHGSLTLLPNGGFTYVPSADFNGTDAFRYLARDVAGATSSVVDVTITIAAVNDAPATQADSFGATEDQTLTVDAPGVLGNDRDVDSASFTAILAAGPAHGTLTFSADGSFVYTPAANFNGTDTFTYRATDGLAASGDTTVTIFVAPVNDPPVGNPDEYTTNEDTTLFGDAPGVLGNDTDIDGDVLQARLAAPAAHGDVALFADGSFVYTPDPNYNGSDGFAYDLSDGTEVVRDIQVTITVIPVDDPPTANDDTYTTTAGRTLTIAAPGVLSNDFDDSGAITAVLVTGVTNGTLTLNADGSFTYTTALATAGSDSFTYKVTDGTSLSNTATVHLTVNNPGGSGGTGSFGSFATPTFVVWDYDVLKIGSGTGTLRTKHGNVIKRTDGTFYVPDRGYRGRDSFDYGGKHYEGDVLSDIWGD